MKKNLQKTIGKYALRFFAVVGALVIGSLLAGALTSWYWVRHPTAALPAPENMVLDLDFSQPIVEQRNFLGLSLNALLKEQEETPLLDIVRALDRAKDDKRVKGIVARFAGIQPSLVHAQEIRAALQRFKESGKFTYVFATNYGDFGQGNRLYYLASAFENIWLQPIGTVGLTGLSLESPFGKTALNNLGVSTDFLRREEYKSVMENVARDSFSAPVRANMESLLKSISEQEIEGIAASRKLEPAKARQLLEEGPYTSQEALKAGLVTKLGYQDDMLEEAKQKAGDDPTRVDVGSYLLFSALKKEP
ncbi:MAG: signal peptide peptidase SppA, partial [Alphaproteobacteria bacterium]|nr:signal peptide peptidase SppA [Alphaproteobacteria bacterium]